MSERFATDDAMTSALMSGEDVVATSTLISDTVLSPLGAAFHAMRFSGKGVPLTMLRTGSKAIQILADHDLEHGVT